MVDIEQQGKKGSHFNTLASSIPKPTPSTKSPLASITPTATQQSTPHRA
jgi:hypothetical protein